MKTFDFNVNYNVPKAEQDENFSNVNLTNNYIQYAVKQKYAEGLQGQLRRVWGRIQRKMDAARDDEKNTAAELEASEVDFLKGLFNDEVRFPALASKYVMVLEDSIKAL